MKIWKCQADSNRHDNLLIVEKSDVRYMIDLRISGSPVVEKWHPIKVELVKHKNRTDIPSFGQTVLTKKALEILWDLIGNKIELLPLDCPTDEYYVVNTLSVLACIDYEKSVFKRFENSSKIMCFDKHAFIKEIVEGEHIFRIVDIPTGFPFVSDEFRNRVLESGLKGFLFTEVWDSEKE